MNAITSRGIALPAHFEPVVLISRNSSWHKKSSDRPHGPSPANNCSACAKCAPIRVSSSEMSHRSAKSATSRSSAPCSNAIPAGNNSASRRRSASPHSAGSPGANAAISPCNARSRPSRSRKSAAIRSPSRSRIPTSRASASRAAAATTPHNASVGSGAASSGTATHNVSQSETVGSPRSPKRFAAAHSSRNRASAPNAPDGRAVCYDLVGGSYIENGMTVADGTPVEVIGDYTKSEEYTRVRYTDEEGTVRECWLLTSQVRMTEAGWYQVVMFIVAAVVVLFLAVLVIVFVRRRKKID